MYFIDFINGIHDGRARLPPSFSRLPLNHPLLVNVQPLPGKAPQEPRSPVIRFGSLSKMFKAVAFPSSSRKLQSTDCMLSFPPQFVNDTFVLPIVCVCDQPSSNRIVEHIIRFFLIVFKVSNASIPMVGMPHTRTIFVVFSKLRLEVLNPGIEFNRSSLRCGKQMKMIRHQYVSSHYPMRCVLPDFQ